MTHALDALESGAPISYGDLYRIRPTKNKGTILGCKRVKIVQIKGHGLKKRSVLRLVSPKQAKRTAELNKKLKRMIIEQCLRVETPHCQKCGRIKNDNNRIKLVADHINTRNEKNADGFWNLGILCWKCNSEKSSCREDYRPSWFKARMLELDAKG